MAGIDAEGLEILDGRFAEHVVADSRYHRDFRATEPRGYGLVGALAAEAQRKIPAENCFAGSGKLVGECGEVDIRAADDDDAKSMLWRRL